MRLFACLLALAAAAPAAQELNCDVTVDRTQITGTEYTYLDDLDDEVERYLNGRAWTDDAYDAVERIDCLVQIQLASVIGTNVFDAQLVVQASRPIYGTAQRSATLLLRDESWRFAYTRGQAFVYDPNRIDPLTSVLDFYALVLLGMDYDSFAPLGGTPYFERARQIADLGRALGTNVPGWGADATDDRSRFILAQQLLDPVYEPVRRAHFTYHFTVLDAFVAEPDAAWTAAVEMLRELGALVEQLNQRRYVTDLFFGARFQEMTALLRDAPQRNEAYALLSTMDPAHLSTYDALVRR